MSRVLLCLFLAFSSLVVDAQNAVCDKAVAIVDRVQEQHYNPRVVDDEYSVLVFDYFIENVDRYKLVFTNADFEKLSTYRSLLDDELLNKDCQFVKYVDSLYFVRLSDIRKRVQELSFDQLDFRKKDTLSLSSSKTYEDQLSEQEKWNAWMKMQVLYSNYYGIDSIVQMVTEEIFKETQQRELCIIDAKLNNKGFVYGAYLNAVAHAFDPHTSYFSEEVKNSFDESLSKEVKSFGIEIDKNDKEEIEIYYIVPGSPAWNSNTINEEDIILSVRNDNEKKSFNCIGLREAELFIHAKDNETLTFELQKKSGEKVEVKLTKEVLDEEENVIQSFVLHGEKKIGYIYLPSFYSQMDALGYELPNGCSNDIAKELVKLKKEEIEGLILDVRDNGGGSMLEAIRLTGVFIDYGAVAIVDQKGEEPQTLKDMSRGVVFSKPLVIMVNGFSASASEFFAAAMQDQNRGVVVGSKTYGKATMQTVVPLFGEHENDYLKLTVGKFYRVDGKSHQKEGVVPNIVLPDYYSKLNLKESASKSALENSSIEKKTYYYPLQALPLEELSIKSKSRIDTSAQFQLVDKLADYIYTENKNYNVPIDFKGFNDFMTSEEKYLDEISIVRKTKSYTVSHPSYFNATKVETDVQKEINEQIIEDIEYDIFIEESYHVINDLINQN